MHRLRRQRVPWTPARLPQSQVNTAGYFGWGLVGWWDANDWLDKPHGTVAAGTVLPDRSGNGRNLATTGASVAFVPRGDGLVKHGLPGILGNGHALRWIDGAAASPMTNQAKVYIGLVCSQYTGADTGYLWSTPRGSGSNGIDLSWNSGQILQYVNTGSGLQSWSVAGSNMVGDVLLVESSIDFELGNNAEWILSIGDTAVEAAMSGAHLGSQNTELNLFDFGSGFSSPVAGILFHEGIVVVGSAMRDAHGAAWRRYVQRKWGARVLSQGNAAPTMG